MGATFAYLEHFGGLIVAVVVVVIVVAIVVVVIIVRVIVLYIPIKVMKSKYIYINYIHRKI